MAEERRSEGGSRTRRLGAVVDGTMLTTTVVLALLVIFSTLMLCFTGQQVAGPERSLATLRPYIAEWLDDLASQKDVGQKQAIIYYRENGGRGDLKAYYTSDWQLQEQPRPKTTSE